MEAVLHVALHRATLPEAASDEDEDDVQELVA